MRLIVTRVKNQEIYDVEISVFIQRWTLISQIVLKIGFSLHTKQRQNVVEMHVK